MSDSAAAQDHTPSPTDGRAAERSDPCAGITCSGHGQCVIDPAGAAACECELAYLADGLSCVGACVGFPCPADQACVPAHHGVTDPMCVDTCDCSNCGNCAIADIPSYGVSYCGSPGGSPPTVSCTRPCKPGYGCIPFATPICWPGQGCLSM